MRPSNRALRLLAAAGLVAAVSLAPSCESGGPVDGHDGIPRHEAPASPAPSPAASCAASGLDEINVFFEGAYDATNRVLGTIALTKPGTKTNPGRYAVREGDKTWTLAYGGTPAMLPVEEGKEYDIRVDYRMGEPSPCGILVRDDHGLLFAAASDYGVGSRVLKDGLPGFELELAEAGCPNRTESACFESVKSQRLRVTHEGATRLLSPGETATLGGYEVTCITAQEVVYTNKCADAALFTVSYAIRRI